MKKIYSLLLLGGLLLLGAQSVWADYGWYSGSMSMGGKTNIDPTSWSTDSNNPTDLGELTDMTITSIAFSIWDDSNDRGGVNMYFRIWDGGASQVGNDQDLWLGSATRIAGDHDFSISWTGTEDLAAAVGITLVPGITYYIDMWAKSYGDAGDHWYSGTNSSNYHAKLTYTGPLTIGSTGWASLSSKYALDFTGTDVTAYIAKAKDASSVTLTEINKVPANTGIVVHAAAEGTYDIPVLSASADATTGNLLQKNLSSAVLATTTVVSEITYYNYTLAVEASQPVFKQSTGVGNLAAGKAYLQTTVNAATAPSLIRIVDENNGATNIDAIGASEEGVKFIENGKLFIKKNNVVYDMMGSVVR